MLSHCSKPQAECRQDSRTISLPLFSSHRSGETGDACVDECDQLSKPGEEGLASGLISTSTRLRFPLGLAVLLTVAGAPDHQPVADVVSAAGLVRGFQFAIATAALLGVLGVLIALRIKEPPKWQNYAPGPQ